jgi:hypothetical protein
LSNVIEELKHELNVKYLEEDEEYMEITKEC